MDRKPENNQTGYQISQKIYESANSLVYRAILQPDNQPIILKILKENYPTPSELTRYKLEYEITRSLNNDGVIKTYDLQRYENSLVMLLEDFGGESLKSLICDRIFTLKEFLLIAIKTTESLAAIHAANIIHKDINPSNIIYNPETEQLKIIDFGLSTRLSRENQTVGNLERLEGTLAYIAPEQTGRMNRGIDYRSDFYSLGASFYELLTNKLPFAATDSIELVHCHIAQKPIPLHELVETLSLTSQLIPKAVSDIVMKLLAKTPEERYQSAWGIKADLETCLTQLQNLGQINPFSLATQDIGDRFVIPEKLYGREKEITQLLTTFERVANPSQGQGGEMMLVSGYSGIGKSALVNEIHKPILRQRGYFIKGKFDQLQRDIPYAAITLAFQDLIRQLLTETEATLQTWKQQLLKVLEPNAQVIIDVIPELEQIIGKQPPVEQLEATEAQNRFNLFFQRFVGIFCKKEHPLVIFLDDLQWADLASLKLIELLITDSDSKYLLFIGAYRDNEVDVTHPLMQTLEPIKKEGARVNNISLQPLAVKYINQLIADTLNCSTNKSKSLAELVNNKTQGNPFFLTQLLQSLHRDKFLSFNHHKKYWRWNIKEIERVGITDNVVDLTIAKITKLDEKTQKILQLAACIGNQFNLAVLSVVNNKSQIATARELQPALESGLIIPLSNDYKIPLLWNQEEISRDTSEISPAFIPKIPQYIPYKFLHDRVQQAAYALIAEDEKKFVHLQVGRLLLEETKEDDLESNIFEIVNQLNEGRQLINQLSERENLAKLNLQAGKKAKASTAYQVALQYVENSLSLLEAKSWKKQYNLTLESHLQTLELLCLNTQFTRVENIANTILEKSHNILEQAKVYQLKISYYYTIFQSQKAIDTGFKILAKLGINISDKAISIDERIEQQQEYIKSFLKDKQIEHLANLPIITDQYKLATIQILQQIMTAAHTTQFSLFVEVVLAQINLCIEYGNFPQAAGVYNTYGILLCTNKQYINDGYEFGKLSLKLLEKINSPKLQTLIIQMYYGQIWPWKECLRDKEAQQTLLNCFQTGIDAGEYEYASYAAINYCLIKLFGGQNLEEVELDYQKYTNLIKKLKQDFSFYNLVIFYNLTTILSKTNNNLPITIENFQRQENELLKEWTAQNNEWLLLLAYCAKIINFYLLKDYFSAFNSSTNAEKYKNATAAYLTTPQHKFYSSLSLIANYHNCTIEQQKKILKQVQKNQEDINIWASHCPANFQNKYNLVAAEKARVLGKNWQAQELYEKAIQGAKQSEFIHEEAIAYERAAEFYLSLAREEIGRLYLKNAHHCYSRWGATAKVQALETEYPQFLRDMSNQQKKQSIKTTESTANTNPQVLDIATVTKASQVLAGEIKLDQLLAKLMKTLIENGGAQTGFLILEKDGQWVIEAEGTVDADEVTLLRSLPIDSIDTDTQTPLLPVTIINYVARTQENVILNNAIDEGQFTLDPYIVANHPKSILCTALLNQGKVSGIIYLENNLTTSAFTSDRIEVLRILSAQAAISIENARLYTQLEDYNRNLELRVEERTEELSQTLEVLKATQAELIFENELLKSDEQASNFDYQVGGSLPMDAPTYVVRSADRYLYQALRRGEVSYILNPRQMGKSSLMVSMMNHLNHEGYSCGAIDLTRIGRENITPEQWYKGLTVELWRSFGLSRKVNLKTWWQEQGDISPVQRLSEFIEEILLPTVAQADDPIPQNLVVFIDEIDSILSLNFPVNDFFALIRSCYNQRSINPEYRRLTFAFFGVATPSNLMADKQRTPFNIGQAIQLEGFKDHEAQPLLQGLAEKVSNPQTLLKEVLAWTNGQPFLTQKLCQFIRNTSASIPTNQEAEWIADLVQSSIIDNWESQDEPEHLRTIRDRLLKSQQSVRLLEIYQQIQHQGEVVPCDSPEENELLLSGLVVKQQGLLRVNNRIYESIFDYSWVEQHLTPMG
ncbi:MAG: AAA family ATPase [Symploca sp. SIO2C1]|nr:AAA family ATPase [Symploca sp. SIO2C1]